jgi:hypothetical protein
MVRHSIIPILLAMSTIFFACAPITSSPRQLPTGMPSAVTTAAAAQIPTSTFHPTKTLMNTATPTPAQPDLPAPYQTSLLNPLDTPHAYIQSSCQYLLDKWSSAKSSPGTVVMVIMFHKITNETIFSPEEISEYNFRQLMDRLFTNDFQAINMPQLAGFLEHNARIPERSVLLVVDDKHTANYFNILFRPYWTGHGWPVVNAWISDDKTTDDLWEQQEELNSEGWVDYQAHGVAHTPPIDADSTEAYILGELQGPFGVFREHFNKTPIAIIWPGGGFTQRAVRLARQTGYRLGFTINPRGPLMFNWIPLADAGDPARDTWIPEGPANDPLMTLPRYWDTDAITHLNEVIQIGQKAAAHAQSNKSAEMEYYDTICSSVYGTIP